MNVMSLAALEAGAPFTTETYADTELGPGQVLISVKAASVNVVDTKIRDGMRAIANDPPVVLGCDVAGVVTKLGPGVSRFAVGDAVYGCAGGVKGEAGSYASAMLADADLLARKPDSLTFQEAAALPLVAITAWDALYTRARVQPGDRLLVHGGTGGVGHIGIQLAKAAGAQVHTTVSSSEKAEIAHALGADKTINYREQSVADYVETHTGGQGYDIVLDTVGGDNIAPSLEAVALNGQVATIVSLGAQPDLSDLHMKNASLHVIFMLLPLLTGQNRATHGRILERLATLVETGAVRPLLDPNQFRLDQVAQAHDHLNSGKAVGKVVLEVQP